MRRPTPIAVLATTAAALAGCGDAGAPDDIVEPARGDAVARVLPAEEALTGVHLPPLDPSTLTLAEIDATLDAPRVCLFRYTSRGRPALATAVGPEGRPVRGVVKLAGHLVLLEAASGQGPGAYRLEAGDIRVEMHPLEGEDALAEMTFAVSEALHAGYRGYYACPR